MNKAEFLDIINKPTAINKEQQAELRDIVKEYPYFQTAHLLLAKSLHNSNDHSFDKQLKVAALYASSRKVLYDLINMVHVEQEIVPAPKEGIKDPETIVDDPDIKEAESKTEIPELHSEENVTSEIRSEIPENSSETIESAAEIRGTEKEENAEAKPVFNANEKHSLAEWAALLKGNKIERSRSEKEEIHTDKVAEIQDSKEEKPEDLNTETSQAFPDVIEKFIEVNPSISRPKAEFYNPVNMARLSVEEDENLVSETLAKINIKQGNYKKAIRIYEKLCLIYPDKMPYFATQIKNLENQQKL